MIEAPFNIATTHIKDSTKIKFVFLESILILKQLLNCNIAI